MSANAKAEPNRERLAVIDNIERAIDEGDYKRKVEIGDPCYTKEDVERKIVPFDCLKRNPINKLKAEIARKIAEKETLKINQNTKFVGIENALSVRDGAIITANHFNPVDNTVIRLLTMRMRREKDLYILVQEGNMFMKGPLGFLMRNCYTLPVSQNHTYTAKNLKPAVTRLIEKGNLLLVYPESEMWFNYKKPRPLAIGAYHYAALLGVPVIPTFIGMEEVSGYDESGFKNIRHTLMVMPPIYPDTSLPERERAAKMQSEDMRAKTEAYENFYKTTLSQEFDRSRDIAGYPDC